MADQSERPDRTVYWIMSPFVILFTALSFLFSGFLVSQIMENVWPVSWNANSAPAAGVRDLVGSGLLLLCVSSVSAGGNYALLRATYPRLPLGAWLLSTNLAALSILLIGPIIPISPPTNLPGLVMVLLGGIGIGAVIGGAQWMILRRYGNNTVWWLIASMVMWIATLALLMLVTSTSTSPPDM
jgi:hypothetical protein